MSVITPRMPGAGPATAAAQTPATVGASRWRTLYTTAAIAALIMTVMIPLQVLVFLLWPPPLQGSAQAWFDLFQANWLIGLLSLDLLLMIDYGLISLTLLALYVALRDVSPSLMLMAVAFNLLAIAIYFASNTAVEMMLLSHRYAAAASDADRALLLAAGEAMLATYTGTAFHVSYIMASIAGIVIALVMLRSPHFRKLTAYMGILGNGVGLGLYIPVVGLWLSVFSVVFLEVWYVLLGLRLLHMARGEDPT